VNWNQPGGDWLSSARDCYGVIAGVVRVLRMRTAPTALRDRARYPTCKGITWHPVAHMLDMLYSAWSGPGTLRHFCGRRSAIVLFI
jgi:hypothetical protein